MLAGEDHIHPVAGPDQAMAGRLPPQCQGHSPHPRRHHGGEIVALLRAHQVIRRDNLPRLQGTGDQTSLECLGIGKTEQEEPRQIHLLGGGQGLPDQILGMDKGAGLYPVGGHQHLGDPVGSCRFRCQVSRWNCLLRRRFNRPEGSQRRRQHQQCSDKREEFLHRCDYINRGVVRLAAHKMANP